MTFRVTATDGAARAGVLETPHGEVPTPAFMPVGTKASVKTLHPDEVRALGASILLGNTYHLHFRPGDEVIAELGGLHAFMGWDGPILTDSGGFQVFSLLDTILGSTTTASRSARSTTARRRGSRPSRSPASRRISAPTSPCAWTSARRPASSAASWRRRCGARPIGPAASARLPARRASSSSGSPRAHRIPTSAAARSRRSPRSTSTATRSAGSPSASRGHSTLDATAWAAPLLPEDKPRYFMGIGDAAGILEVIERGIDMFDCVLPTRTARTGSALTWEGRLNLRNARFARDPEPLDGLPLSCVRPFLAGVHPAPGQPGGAARPPPADFAQPLLRSRRHSQPGRRSKQVNWHPLNAARSIAWRLSHERRPSHFPRRDGRGLLVPPHPPAAPAPGGPSEPDGAACSGRRGRDSGRHDRHPPVDRGPPRRRDRPGHGGPDRQGGGHRVRRKDEEFAASEIEGRG